MPHKNLQQTIFIDFESQLDTTWPDGIQVFCKDTNNTWVLDNGVFVAVGGANIFIQNGINTFTGGTTTYPTVNVTAATLNNLTVSGATSLATVSATTYYSGSTDLSLLFGSGSGTNPMSGNNTVQSLQTNNSFYIGGYNTSISKGDGSVALFLAEAYYGSFAWAGGYYNRAYIGPLTGETNTQQGSIAMGPGYDNFKKGNNSSAAFAISNNYWIKSGNTSSGIYSGQENIIGYNQPYSSILGGSGNTIQDDLINPFSIPWSNSGSSFNTIIGGLSNKTNSGLTGTTIIGGSKITATTSNTTYTNNMVVTGTSMGKLYATQIFSGNTDLSLLFGAGGSGTAFSGIGNGNIVQINSTLTNRPLNNGTERSLAINSAEIAAGGTGYAFGGDGAIYQVFIGPLTGESNTVTNSVAFGSSYDNGRKGINASNSFGLGGQYWIKSGSSAAFILGGIDNIIGYNRYAAGIIGGSGNTIDSVATATFPYLDSRNVIIINGFRNSIVSGITGTTVIGGRLLTGTSNDTTYTNNMVVTGTSMGKLYATQIFSGSTDLSSLLTGGSTGYTPETIYVALSDETTQITTGTNKVTIYAPYAFTLTDVKASLSQSGTSATTFNVKLTGTTIFSTKPTIDANEFSTSTAATPKVITATTIPVDSKITFDIDTVGTGAAGAKVYLMGFRI